MDWYIVSVYPSASTKIDEFPFCVGRDPKDNKNSLTLLHPTVSRDQFVIESRLRGVFYKNLSQTAPAQLDGAIVADECKLEPETTHVIHMGNVSAVIGTDYGSVSKTAARIASERYLVSHGGEEYGPMLLSELLAFCEDGTFSPLRQNRARV